MTELDSRVAELAGPRRALLEALLRRSGNGAPVDAPEELRPSRPEDGDPVLSPGQRRLWFVEQLNPGGSAYNVPLALRLTGPLDARALQAALQDVVDRHDVLRTVYEPQGTEARPVVLASRVTLGLHDLSGPGAVDRFLEQEAARPFRLDREPPLRALLGRVGPDEHVLLLAMHHIAVDGWSVRLLFHELSARYGAHSGGAPVELPPLPVQYADVGRWQRRRLQGPVRERLVDFWREELAGTTVLDLPTDRPRPAQVDTRGASLYDELPESLVARLRELGRTEGATLYMVLLAGFAATLARWTDGADLVLGASVSGREHPDTRDLIGFFVNTVPVRARLSDDPTFRELVRRTRTATLSAYAHQDLPFDVLVDSLGLRRDPSRPPLLPVMFLLDETADEGPALPGLEVEQLDLDLDQAKYELMLNLHDSGGAVRMLAQYPTALFDAGTVARLLVQWRTLLEAAVEQPGAAVSALPVLSSQERRLVADANDTATPLSESLCLHHLFEQQVDRQPDAPALVRSDGRRTSYAELEQAANRLAHRLVAAGVGPDRTVAICLPRGPQLVTAVLAVLKAGGAFTPLDPDYPPQRLAVLLADSRAQVVITLPELLPRLDAPAGAALLPLGTDGRADRPDTAVDGHDLAYVIFTSGSTGRPKGIALEHHGVVNNLLDLTLSHDVGPGDAVLALSSPSFDMSVFEVLGMLGAGGTVVLPDQDGLRDPAHWAALVARHGVTVWNSAPALLDLLLEHLEAVGGTLPGLRLALLGGDWIPVAQPDRLRALAPDVCFVALGGATEASIHSIEHVVDVVDPAGASIPYGRPMANQRAYVLDGRDRPVPVGVPGELHLAGSGLARGYLHQPELTAERFVQVEVEPGRVERLYRTGDRARWRADGVLELLGRTDFRIKLHGLRIEPGEVEAALRCAAGVRDAVVVARADGGQSRLVGYVVAEPGARIDPVDVRTSAAARLPASCVPASVVVLPQLPLSPNGKVDRSALPPPAVPQQRTRGAAPDADPRVAAVQAAWAEVLELEAVGPDDDFFDLGGDSFAAVRAARVLGATVDADAGPLRDVRVADVFASPTPRGLVGALAPADGRPPPGLLQRVAPARTGVELTLVCLPHGGGDAVAYGPLASALPAGLELLAVSPPGHDVTRPGALVPVGLLAERVADEVLRAVPGPFAVYGHCAGVVAALELTRVLEERGAQPVSLFLAAALPEEDPEASLEIERTCSDDEIADHLRGMGGFDGVLDDRDLGAVLRVVRHDMTEAARFFARTASGFPTPVRTPLTVVLGGADPATAGSSERHRAWEPYAPDCRLVELPGAGHYFAKHQPTDLAALLAERLRQDRSTTTRRTT